MNELRDLADQVYLGNELRAWALALAVFALLFTVLPLARAAIQGRLRKYPHQSRAALEITLAVIDRTTRLFLIAVAIWLSTRSLSIPDRLDRALDVALLAIVWFQVARWGTTIVSHLVHPRRNAAVVAEGDASLNILRFIAVTAVWSVALLMLLANLGVEIMPLVAGLGIGGIALALAVQNVLGDLLASLSIALDKPFRVGDFLALGDERGTVEQIGIKSTRLRSTTGEQIVMANGELLKSRLRNYGLLPERRAEVVLRIAYETPREQVAAIPAVDRGRDPGAIESPLRACASRAPRRLRAALRGGVPRAGPGTERVHGCAAGDPAALARRARASRHRHRLPDQPGRARAAAESGLGAAAVPGQTRGQRAGERTDRFESRARR